jgi:RNA polymerase sigma factor (sigma-70 family)
MMESDNLENLVESAKKGDKTALNDLLMKIKDRIFGLALRMLGDPFDGEDATQEILIKTVTHLSEFRQESAFSTWVYRIASNHLLAIRKRRAELACTNFDDCAKGIDMGLASKWHRSIPEAILTIWIKEMRISCTQGMLLCLDRDHRLAYILGEIFEVSGEQGGAILNITPAAFRKRLSRSRDRLYHFMEKHCGLINPFNPCTCEKQIIKNAPKEVSQTPKRKFTSYPCHGRYDPDVMNRIKESDQLSRMAAIFRNHPDYKAPDFLVNNLKEMIVSEQYELFNESNLKEGSQ